MSNTTFVVGLGETGFSCVKYLSSQNQKVMVADTRENPPKLEACRQQFPAVEIYLGAFSEALFLSADKIVVSPGVSLDGVAFQKAREKNIPIVGDIELFVKAAKAPIVAITGSNGKTTLTTLMGKLIEAAGKKVIVCGNIGTPVLDVLAEPVPDYYVLELSSFQLEVTNSLRAKVAVLTNISPDHMDRYVTLDDYLHAKQRIYLNCDYAVVNADEKITWEGISFKNNPILFTSGVPSENVFGIADNALMLGHQKLIAISALQLQEKFNLLNFLAALAMGSALQLPMDTMLSVIQTFSGLPHRCQRVQTSDGIFWYNDSKGTNPGAVIAAIESVSARHHPKQLILIAGGDGKGVDFSILQPVVSRFVSQVIVLGKDAALLEAALKECAQIHAVKTVKEAVALSKAMTKPGDVVLLSPACSSLDQYKNYAARGADFVSAVLS